MLEVDEPTGRTETTSRQRYLEPGLGLRISDLTDTLGGYAANVVEVDDRTIWIDLPIRRDGMLNLSTGQLVSVRFDRPDDAVYLFDSVVSAVRDDDQAPFGIALPVTINRRQHRSDARLSLVLDASFDSGQHTDLTGKVVDLSAGGLGLICENEIPLGTTLTVRCGLPGPDGHLSLDEDTVVRTASIYGRTPGGVTLFQYGLKFSEPTPELREQIVASVIWNLTRNPTVL